MFNPFYVPMKMWRIRTHNGMPRDFAAERTEVDGSGTLLLFNGKAIQAAFADGEWQSIVPVAMPNTQPVTS
jgi:hypothetical protein